jgi:hypothetical protein
VGRTTQLRRAIKNDFVPYLRDKGFSVDMRRAPQFFTFRRIGVDAVYVCDVQWEKYGRPRFVVNFGRCSAQGVVLRGGHVRPADVFPPDTSDYGRLYPGRSRTISGWFRQDRPFFERLIFGSKSYPVEKVTSQLMMMFGEIENFWETGSFGPHLRLMGRPPSPPPAMHAF